MALVKYTLGERKIVAFLFSIYINIYIYKQNIRKKIINNIIKKTYLFT